MGTGYANMNPMLVSGIQAMIAAGRAAGVSISPGSGYRSYEEQAQLYRDYKAGKPGQARAAPPGQSNHNHGLAMDLRYGSDAARNWALANAGKFGLVFPMGDEPWHVQLANGAKTQGFYQGAQQMGAYGFDMKWADNPMSEEERREQLLTGYLDAMVGANRDELASMSASPGTDMAATPAVASLADTPEIAQGQSPEDIPETMGPLRQDTTTIPGTPDQAQQMPAGGGGGFGGNVPPPGYNPPGSGTDRWRDVAIAALKYTGQDPGLVGLLLMQMGTESGGDPNAINQTDINAQRGDPSIGLMQNIGSAFPDRARELTSRGIRDGFANIVASIRYTLGRYGSLQAGWKGHGY